MSDRYLDAVWSDDGLRCWVVLPGGRRVLGEGESSSEARRDLGSRLGSEPALSGGSLVVRSHSVGGSSQMLVSPGGDVVDLPDPPVIADVGTTVMEPVAGADLVRTDFGDDGAWLALLQEVTEPSAEGFVPNVAVVEDFSLTGASAERVLRQRGLEVAPVVFLADDIAMAGRPRSVLAARGQSGRVETFRVAAGWVWAVENNLSLANMGWAEFADAARGGVFRGWG